MSSSDNTAHVFIDTNVALHYRRMDEIDWRQLTGADKVVIVITPVFFRELDKQKVTNKSEKIRDRAKKTVKWLWKCYSEGSNSIRDGVTLHIVTHEPEVDFKYHNLSNDVADDHLIASALDYHLQHDLDQPVFIATDDTGLKIKARDGIKLLELPDKFRLKSEPDKHAKPRQREEFLESRIPKLSVAFEGGKDRLKLSFVKPTMKDVLSPSQIRKKYPLKEVNIPVGGLPKPRGVLKQFGSQPHINIRHNKKLNEYYERYDKYYEDRVAYEEEASLYFYFQLVISNKGTTPASNIDLYLNLPDGVKAVDKFPEEPKCPPPSGQGFYNRLCCISSVDYNMLLS